MIHHAKQALGGLLAGLAIVTAGRSSGPQNPNDNTPVTVPDFAVAAFSDPSTIDNPQLPFAPGTTWTYEGETEDGTERVVVEALDETRMVRGISCRVVRDRAFLDNVLVEDTHDFFAQDDAGNVWYMGEEVDNYAYGTNGALLEITHEGAWEAGKDVAGVGKIAQPGFAMKVSPQLGDVYHQEYYLGEAEDIAEVVALDVQVNLSDGASHTCLQTRDFSSLDPQANERKYYAPNLGLVLEETVGSAARLELISVEP
jgi:hypothetical protein